MKSFSEKEILELLKNKDTKFFKEAIEDSKGFILYLCDKYNIDLLPDLLIETITPYSIRFITEHMLNHKYNKNQIEIITSYLTEGDDYQESKDDLELKQNYTLEKLFNDIENGNNIPRDIDKTLNITFEDFIKNQKSFIELIGTAETYYNNNFYKSHYLLDSIFKNLSREQFLQIDNSSLVSCPGFFHMAKHLMHNEDIKLLFNKVVNEYYNQEEHIKQNSKPMLDNYKNYHFNENEKDFFLDLLMHNYSKDYKTVSKHKGFDKLFTKNEYILNYNISDIEYFTEKEIADNLHIIRKSIIAAYFSSKYTRIERLYDLKISEDSFKDIFKPEYIKEIVHKINEFSFTHFDRDNKEKTIKINILEKRLLKLCAEDFTMTNIVGFNKIIDTIINVYKNNRNFFDQEYKESLNGVLGNLPQLLKTDVIFNNFEFSKKNSFDEYDVKELMFAEMKGKESINYLFTIVNISNNKKKLFNGFVKEGFTQEINRIIPLLNKQDVLLVGKALNYKFDKSLLKDNPRQSFEDNFFNFTPENIKNLSFINFSNIFEISQDFRHFVLENKLDNIIINNKTTNLNDKQYSDFIYTILFQIKDNTSPYYKFMKSFIKNNKEFMLEHYHKDLLKHPLRESFIKIDNEKKDQLNYKKIEIVYKDVLLKSLEIENLETKNKELKGNALKKSNILLEFINNEIDNLKVTLKELFENISLNFYLEKIKEADMITAINLVNAHSNKTNIARYSYQNILIEKANNLTFNQLKKLITDNIFLDFFIENKKDNNHKDKKSIVVNNTFTDIQNIEIIEDLIYNLKNTNFAYNKYKKSNPLTDVLCFFSPERKYEISNELSIKHIPEDIFYSYSYLPGESGYGDNHVLHRYSNEQIIRAIDNLKSKGLKIISSTDVNGSHDNLLTYNFQNPLEKNKENKPNPLLDDYLYLLKDLENDPINYLACIHSDIINNFIEKENYKSIDLGKSAFYNKHINIDVIIEAIEEIAKLYKQREEEEKGNCQVYKGVSLDKAIAAFQNFTYFTYCTNNDIKDSHLSEEKSKKILNKVIKEAPFLYFSLSSIGKLSDTKLEIKENFADYYHENMVEDFFLSSYKQEIVANHLQLQYDKRKENWQSISANNFMESLIQHLMETKDLNNISKIDFILKEKVFNQSRPYGEKISDFNSPFCDFAANEEYLILIKKSLTYIKMIEMSDRLKKISTVKTKTNKI